MKNTIKLLGIIALTAIIGFTMTACDNGGGGGSNNNNNNNNNNSGNNAPKTLVVTGITPAMQANSAGGFLLGVYPTGTTLSEATADGWKYLSEVGGYSKVVAGCDDVASTLIGTTLTTPLKSSSSDFASAWTGSGTYDLWFICVDGLGLTANYYIYRMTGVSITSASTTIAAQSTSVDSGPITDLL